MNSDSLDKLKHYLVYQSGIRKSYNCEKGLELIRLNELHDKNVLEVACGEGIMSIFLSAYARNVIGIDILEAEVEKAKSNLKQYNRTNCNFLSIDIINAELEEESFDLIIGKAALHHIIYDYRIGEKLFKLLRPKGRLIFLSEPLSYNWFNEFVRFCRHMRRHLSGEFKLWYENIAEFGNRFDKINYYYFDIFSQPFKAFELILPKKLFKIFIKVCWKIDDMLIKNFKKLRKYSPNVNIEMIKD